MKKLAKEGLNQYETMCEEDFLFFKKKFLSVYQKNNKQQKTNKQKPGFNGVIMVSWSHTLEHPVTKE